MCEDREALKAELKEELKEEFVSREEFERERERRRRTERALAEFERDAEKQQRATDAKADAALAKGDATKDAVTELQQRELEKGGHLYKPNVFVEELGEDVGERLVDSVEDDGRHFYHDPEAEGGVDVDGDRMLWDDLLPIQQLSRLPDDVREESVDSQQDERALWLWENREGMMKKGCAGVDRYIDSGDLQTHLTVEYDIERNSEAARRVMEAFRDLCRHKVRIEKNTRNGYTERRLVIPEDAEIPRGGPTAAPENADAHEMVSG